MTKRMLADLLGAAPLPLPLKLLITAKVDKLTDAQLAQYTRDAVALLTPVLADAGACDVLRRWGVNPDDLRAWVGAMDVR